jgi:type II secretory pathway component PulF
MTRYRYVLAHPGESTVSGLVEASTAAEAADTAARPGWIIVRLEPEAETGSLSRLLSRDISIFPTIDHRTFVSLVRQWAQLVEAGVTLVDAVRFSNRGRNGRTSAVLDGIVAQLRSGGSFATSLAAAGTFPPVFVAVVEAAEHGGFLASALRKAGDDARLALESAGRMRNALVYPGFLALSACVAILVLLVVVVPAIEEMAGEAGVGRLPVMATVMVTVSRVARETWHLALAATVAVAIVLGLLSRTVHGGILVGGLLLRTPLIGRVVKGHQLGRYLGVMAQTVAGGVPIDRAQALAFGVLANRQLSRRLASIGPAIAAGTGLASAMEATGTFAAEPLALVRSGEATGRLAEVLGSASSILTGDADETIATALAIVGPTVTIVFGAIAGVVVYVMMTTILAINELAIG